MSIIRILLIAGIAVELAAPAMAADGASPGRPPAPYDDSVTSNNEYRGHWVGTWHGEDGRVYSGDYEGSFHGTVNGADLNAQVLPPPWRGDRRGYYPSPPYAEGPAGGVYYVRPGVTTIIVQPATTTTTTYVDEEIVELPSRPVHRTRRVHRECRCK